MPSHDHFSPNIQPSTLAGTAGCAASAWQVQDKSSAAAQPLYAVDGWFFTQRVSGIQRYAIELLAALDPIIPPGTLELVLPEGARCPAYQNIRVVPWGQASPRWEQLDYPRYLAKAGRRWLCMCNVIPLAAPSACRGIAVWHDVCYRARPDFYRDPRGLASAAWHRLQYRAIAARARRIVTVSEFSKSEIQRYYGVAPDRIKVIYNAWQQMQRIEPDEGILDNAPPPGVPALRRGEYYFSMANLLKNKNFPWVLRAAKAAPGSVFAIAGGGSLRAEAEALGLADLPNVRYLGYVTDGEAKALMANCRAFLFPTLYEGFGIPPLEAIACGAPRVIVSDTPCMREIYGPHAAYLDPAAPCDPAALPPPAAAPAELLGQYSWSASARRLAGLLGL